MRLLRVFLFALALALSGYGATAGQIPDEPNPVNATQTVTIRIEVYDSGTLVYSQEYTLTVGSELEFRNRVGNLQAAAARLLNAQGKSWNRITYVLVRVH